MKRISYISLAFIILFLTTCTKDKVTELRSSVKRNAITSSSSGTPDPSGYNMSNTTIYACSDYFYDPGGSSANYSNNSDYVETIYPSTSGYKLRASFISFELENYVSYLYDYLRIYNGPSTASPIIGTYYGTYSPGTVTSSHSTGALTFEFHSDVSNTYVGWKASLSCVY